MKNENTIIVCWSNELEVDVSEYIRSERETRDDPTTHSRMLHVEGFKAELNPQLASLSFDVVI